LWQALGRKAYYIELYELIRGQLRNHNSQIGGSGPACATIYINGIDISFGFGKNTE